MRGHSMRLFFVASLLLGSTYIGASPVYYQRKESGFERQRRRVLLETAQFDIFRDPDAKDSEFENIYWINLEDSLFDRFSLEQLGTVQSFVADQFAILRVEPEQLLSVVDVLHEERGSCGQLIRLFGDEVSLNTRAIKATPLIPIATKIASLSAQHSQVDPEEIHRTVDDMVKLETRYAKSKIASNVTGYLQGRYQELRGDRQDISIEAVTHASSPAQASVVVRINGKSRPDEIIILGSHIDSIAPGSELAPGADDNASGTASQLEVFRTIVSLGLQFERTIEIHGYAAEELGLLGSQDLARKYANAGKKVIAMVQNDMNMFRAQEQDTIWLISNDSDPKLTSDLETLIKQYQTVAMNKGVLRAGTSDHRAWYRQGFPVAFPTEHPTLYNKKLHTPQDTVEQSGDFTQSAEFVKLSLSFLAHFAGLREAASADL